MRNVYSRIGSVAFKAVRCKIFAPGDKKPKIQMYRAQPGKVLLPHNVEQVIRTVVDNIEQKWFPGHDYRFVPIGAAEFNFVHEDECNLCKEQKLLSRIRVNDLEKHIEHRITEAQAQAS
jgi:hypothetical protein